MNYEKEFVEMLIQRLNIELKKQDRSGIYGLTQRLIAYNSNKIEGSTLTEKHTASLFETGTFKADGEVIRAKDVEEMTGHFSMFNHMIKTLNETLSEKLIKELHHYLKTGVFEDLANGYVVGEYKDKRNFIGYYETTEPSQVGNAIKELLEEYNVDKIHTLEEIANFHVRYEIIHPFQDGNGRTGRIIAFRECLKSKIVPFIVQDKNKDVYLDSLNDYREDNSVHSLFHFFKKEQIDYYDLAKDVVVPYKQNTSMEERIKEAKEKQEKALNEYKNIIKGNER